MIRPFRTDLRHHSFSSRASSASLSDDDDAITPVDTGAEVDTDADGSEPECLSVHLPDASCSSPSPNSTTDTAHLWRRMLALQRRFHCYNSARISAALESELVEAIVPPRTCLDLLNDSVAAQLLPDEARREVAALMSGHAETLCELNDCDASPEPAVVLQTATRPLAAAGPMATRSSKARSKARQRRRRVWRIANSTRNA